MLASSCATHAHAVGERREVRDMGRSGRSALTERTATERKRRRGSRAGEDPPAPPGSSAWSRRGARCPALRAADPLEVDQDPGGEQRTLERPRPASSTAGDEAPAERAVEAEEARGVRRLRAGLEDRSGPAASRWRSAPDDPVSQNGSPEAAVVARATVVAHHEVMVIRNSDLFRQIAGSACLHGRMKLSLRTSPLTTGCPSWILQSLRVRRRSA